MGDSQEVKDMRKFINKGNATQIATGKSIVDALGTDGTTELDTAYSIHGVLGVNDAANAYDSSAVSPDADGSILERLEHLLVSTGGTIGDTSALGTTTTAIDSAWAQANDYWNGMVFVCLDGANAGLARPIVDYDLASTTVTVEPAFPNAVANGVKYIILDRFDAAQILGANTNDNAFASGNVVANADGSVLERLEYTQANIGPATAASDTVYTQVRHINKTAVDGTVPPVTNTLADTLHKDGSYTYDNTTDSLEAISDKISSGLYRKIIFKSATSTPVTLTSAAGDVALPSITVPALSGITGTPVFVYAYLKYRKLVNSNAAQNAINGAIYIQVAESVAGVYANAIYIQDNSMDTDGSASSGGDLVCGNTNCVTTVSAFNKTYNFKFLNVAVDANNLLLHDVQVILEIYYTV